MSNFDLAAFRKAKFQPREQDVPLAGLTAGGFGGYEGEGDQAQPVPVVFRVRGLTADECAKLLESGEAELIDVREVNEWEAERIPGATLYPLSNFYILPAT